MATSRKAYRISFFFLIDGKSSKFVLLCFVDLLVSLEGIVEEPESLFNCQILAPSDSNTLLP